MFIITMGTFYKINVVLTIIIMSMSVLFHSGRSDVGFEGFIPRSMRQTCLYAVDVASWFFIGLLWLFIWVPQALLLKLIRKPSHRDIPTLREMIDETGFEFLVITLSVVILIFFGLLLLVVAMLTVMDEMVKKWIISR